MNKERIFLFLSIILILLLLLMTEFQKPIATGEIDKISGKYPVRMQLKNQSNEIIIFQNEINLKKGDIIEIHGSQQNEKEIIAHKIKCLNC